MLRAAAPYREDYQLVLAGAPGIAPGFYERYMEESDVKILFGQTYDLLRHARAALVTSGTATLETALFRVPQAVCYYTGAGKLVAFLKRHVLKVEFVSLVNLIAGREVVKELVADKMTVELVRRELEALLYNKVYVHRMLEGYEEMVSRLGTPGAPRRAAQLMVELLRKSRS